MNTRLEGRRFLATDDFTIADAYLMWALTLCTKIGASCEPYPNLAAYLKTTHARAKGQEALAAETEAVNP